MVIEFFWLAVHGFIVYGLWQLFIAWWTQNKIEDLNQTLDDFNEHIIICRVEEQDGMFYFYNVLDETFVGQGRTIEEISDISDRLQKQLLMEDGDEEIIAKLKKMAVQHNEVRS